MKKRSISLHIALVLTAHAALAAGAYQRTQDGKTLIWNNAPVPGEQAEWSGKRDKTGFATGSGTLTWYKVTPTLLTGSNIPDKRRNEIVVARYSGQMVQGKFEGAVTYVDATGKKSPATFVDGNKVGTSAAPPSTATPKPRRQLASSPSPTTTPIAGITPTPIPPKTALRAPRATLVPEESPTSVAEETQAPAPPAEGPAATPEQSIAKPDSQSSQTEEKATGATPSPPADDALHSLTAPPSALPKENLVAALAQPSPRATPPVSAPASAAPGRDSETVADLDNQYQEAVKANDAATMDRILADDFVLVTGRGGTLTKLDLVKAAREKRTNYEHQEPEEGTQKVRIWGDTAVVTALLRIKGTRDEKPLDYKIWSSGTYVRTPDGWRYVFGQTSTPLSKSESTGR